MSEPAFLGSGWALAGPPTLTADGEQSVRESIELILRTAPGERVMRPDFGCRLRELVFAPNDAATAGAASTAVADALALWEPRIDVVAVTAHADPGDPGRLLVEIDYRVRSTNSRVNLVHPFHLE